MTRPERHDPGFSPGVHGARGLFCFMVFAYHVLNSGLPGPARPDLAEHAVASLRYGVELFFAISGFVILATATRARTPTAFLVNRASRILPVLWVTVLAFVPLGIAGGEAVAGWLRPAWLFALALGGNLFALGPMLPVPVFYGVTWTISYELTFYLLVFAGLWGRARGWDLRWPLALAGLVLVAFHPRALFFACGVLVALGLLRQPWARRLAAAPALWLLLFLAAWEWAAADQSPFFPPMTEWAPGLWLCGVLAFAGVTFGLAGIADGRGLLGRLLVTPPLLWLGTVSYSLYLWHPIVLGVVKEGMERVGLVAWAGEGSQALLFLLALPPALLVSHGSQRVLETRATAWLRRRWSGLRLTPAGAAAPRPTP